MERFDFRRWWLGLPADERERFAREAGTTPEYVRIHLIAPLARRKTPRRELMDAMVRAGAGRFSREDLLSWFFPETEAA